MINVYSFQKMITSQDPEQQKNISKTSQFSFGQNYKKIITNSKISFDFRKFLQKNHHYRKNITHQSKRLPLEEVSSQTNTQNLLTNKAFKIRCYTKKTTKQNDKNQQQLEQNNKLMKYRPKIYEIKLKKVEQEKKKNKIMDQISIKMHKFDNYELLQPISNNIKIIYNLTLCDNIMQKVYDCAVVFDMDFLINNLKNSGCLKFTQKQKQRERQFYRKKIILFIKKMIEDDFIEFPLQRTREQQTTQIIFKVKKQTDMHELVKQLQLCEFKQYFAVFYIQQKFIESVSVYNLMRIQNLAQNVIILDDAQCIMKNIPLINSYHFVGYSTICEKSNFFYAFENFYRALENYDIRFSAQEFQEEKIKQGYVIQFPFKQLTQRIKQKINQKSFKKISRSRKQRCQSSYQNLYNRSPSGKEDKKLQMFRQKMLKYLKIVRNQTQFESKQIKKSKQYQNNHDELKEEFNMLTNRQNCSKTNYQIVSELVRLNNNINKQINNYLIKNEQVTFSDTESSNNNDYSEYVRSEKIYINIFS